MAKITYELVHSNTDYAVRKTVRGIFGTKSYYCFGLEGYKYIWVRQGDFRFRTCWVSLEAAQERFHRFNPTVVAKLNSR